MGLVYLVHFDRPLQHAKHYLGWTSHRSPRRRLDMHRNGYGAKILAECNRQGIGYHIVRVWRNVGRVYERELKNRKNAPRLCPCCNAQIRNKYRFHRY